MRAPRGARVPAARSPWANGPPGSRAHASHRRGSSPADQPGAAARASAVLSPRRPALCLLRLPRLGVGGAPFTPFSTAEINGARGWWAEQGDGRVVPAVRHCFPTPRSVRKHTLGRVCLCVRACVCTRRRRLLRLPGSSGVAGGISPQPEYMSWQEVPITWSWGKRDTGVGVVPEPLAGPGVRPGLDVNFELQPWTFPGGPRALERRLPPGRVPSSWRSWQRSL